MLVLIERIEAASGPDRELDAEICCVLRIGTEHSWATNFPQWLVGNNGQVHLEWGGPYFSAPAFTASLDAAMTLMPEGYDWAVFRTNDGLTIHAWCGNRDDVFGATPALALTASALRARMAMADAAD